MQIDELTIDRLAQRIHENYLAAHAPGGRSWYEVTEDVREANRAQARDISVKLAAIGATVEFGADSVPFVFSPSELDRLAEVEHRRWVEQRIRAGWSYAPVRNDAAKQHPMILSWDLLPEVEREKDRDALRNIPEVLAGVGLRIIRS
jgi:hypothetical protein